MTEKEVSDLITRYTQNKASSSERQLVEKHFLKYLQSSNQLPSDSEIEDANREIWNNLQNHIGSQHKPGYQNRWRRFAIAASVLFTVLAGSFFGVKYLTRDTEPVVIVGKADVPPGKNTATLTLAHGQTIQLSELKSGIIIDANHLAYDDGTALSTAEQISETNSQLTATTPNGGTYQITLSDGTHVWLNAGTSLKFPARFTGKERKVELNGEAYFEVAKTSQKTRAPFIVSSKGQQVEVLGTHFNIKSYEEEPHSRTTLLEGSVRISALINNSIRAESPVRLLRPNQEARLKEGEFVVKEVNAEEAIAWKNGYFDFNEEKLGSIMNKIGRWYNVTVIYEAPELKEMVFTGNISRSEKISEVLRKLALTKVLRFRVEDKKVTVSK